MSLISQKVHKGLKFVLSFSSYLAIRLLINLIALSQNTMDFIQGTTPSCGSVYWNVWVNRRNLKNEM